VQLKQNKLSHSVQNDDIIVHGLHIHKSEKVPIGQDSIQITLSVKNLPDMH
jgi:hypothetical protein